MYNIIKVNKIDILFLQETHCDYKNELNYITEFKRNGIYQSFFNIGTSNSAGVAICCVIRLNMIQIPYNMEKKVE